MTIHADLSKPNHELLAMIAKLHAENAALKARQPKPRSVSFKVTEPKLKDDGTMTKGGAISVYGMGRFPVTLYRGQWERLIEAIPELQAFIQANAASLSSKE
jgi:hypothetical protein